MRFTTFAAFSACMLLGACDWQAGQANNAQGNISEDARTGQNAVASTAVPQLATQAVGKDEAAKLMHERHEGMEAIGKAVKTIGRELKAGTPNLKEIQTASGKIAELAPKVPGWFPPGTGPDVAKTRAKPEIWQKPDDFALKAHDFATAAASLNSAATQGDLNGVKSAFDQLGKSCKACHDPYRAPHH